MNKTDQSKRKWKDAKPSHEKLWIWQKAHSFHLKICEICKSLPANEKFNLRIQIEKSSKSVEDDIAEGNGSFYFNNKIKGFLIARKEAAETQNHLRDMEDKNYMKAEETQLMINEYEGIIRGINGMVRGISKKRENHKRGMQG